MKLLPPPISAPKRGAAPHSPFRFHAPLILELSNKEIIEVGLQLGVDYSLTHSRYDTV
ncbi:hypothetical protein VU07_05080 [Desulfobulbus sp. F4]|nr:hypothetical protein [Desulfobulbus sp. F3]MCW5201151.1 hypothetical protein [Desulfobulbus sp. F4]